MARENKVPLVLYFFALRYFFVNNLVSPPKLAPEISRSCAHNKIVCDSKISSFYRLGEVYLREYLADSRSRHGKLKFCLSFLFLLPGIFLCTAFCHRLKRAPESTSHVSFLLLALGTANGNGLCRKRACASRTLALACVTFWFSLRKRKVVQGLPCDTLTVLTVPL